MNVFDIQRGQSLSIEASSQVVYYYSVLKFFPESIVNDMILCQKIKPNLVKQLPESFFSLASKTLSMEKNGEQKYVTYNYVLDEFIYTLINNLDFEIAIQEKFQNFNINSENLISITTIFLQTSALVVNQIRVEYQNQELQIQYNQECVRPLVLYKEKSSIEKPLLQMMDEMKLDDNLSISTMGDSKVSDRSQPIDRSQSDVRDLSMAMQMGKMKKFTKSQTKMQDSIFSQILNSDSSDKPWQIARQLVVIVHESNIITEQQIRKTEKVRFIQPATDFYRKVLQIWMLEKSSSCQKTIFSQFICKVKHFFGNYWNDKYMTSLYCIFQQLEMILSELMQQTQDPIYLIIQIVQILQDRMKTLWEQNIIVNARNLINRN